MANSNIIDRSLPERSKLLFYFPGEMESNYYVVEFPFFENIKIKESKKAKYQKYSLISRSSNLYSYLGADSRKIKLSFTMTLPHILEEHPEVTKDKYMRYALSKENILSEKEKFTNPIGTTKTPNSMAFLLGTDYTKKLAKETANQLLNTDWIAQGITVKESAVLTERYGVNFNNSLISPNINYLNIIATAAIVQSSADIASSNYNKKNQIIDLIIYWTNLIRASVVNYSTNPLFGPPIIRLRHGILYQDVPCICTNYSLDYDEVAGYDIDTLLPRKLKFTLDLEEFRTGDFGDFKPKENQNPVKRDNLAGWESVILGDTNSMDPGYEGIL